MAVVEIRDLHKHYGAVHAVDGLTLSIEAGEVYALLGANGAGKSTAVEILEGHRTATSGTVEVLGIDPARAGRDFRDRIGIVLQSSGVESEFTVREVIDSTAAAIATHGHSTRSSHWSASTRRSTHASARSPGASAAASTWPSASSGVQSCCSWTSRRPGSTRPLVASRGI
jgi:ABC-type sugar transport system ATPase subunit